MITRGDSARDTTLIGAKGVLFSRWGGVGVVEVVAVWTGVLSLRNSAIAISGLITWVAAHLGFRWW